MSLPNINVSLPIPMWVDVLYAMTLLCETQPQYKLTRQHLEKEIEKDKHWFLPIIESEEEGGEIE